MSEIKRAVIYARFSSDMQREESIEVQVRACKEYCRKNAMSLPMFMWMKLKVLAMF